MNSNYADDPNVCFARILLPPECRPDHPDPKMIAPRQALYPMNWLRSVGKDDPAFTDHLGLQTDLRQLGVMTNAGDLNAERLQLISDYIWDHRDDAPSFFTAA